jgi:hypothetical protein
MQVESKAKNPDVKENKKMKVEVLDNKTEANDDDKNPEHFNSDQPKEIFASDCQAYNSDVFEERKHFNDWFENELKKKQRKPKAGQAVETPGHNFYTNDDSHRYKQVYEGRKYEQLFTNSQDNYSKDINKLPHLLLYLQAYFVLLLSTCKTLNEQIDLFSILYQSPPPLFSYPVQPTPLSPRSHSTYKTESSCVCVMAGIAITRSVAKVAEDGGQEHRHGAGGQDMGGDGEDDGEKVGEDEKRLSQPQFTLA